MDYRHIFGSTEPTVAIKIKIKRLHEIYPVASVGKKETGLRTGLSGLQMHRSWVGNGEKPPGEIEVMTSKIGVKPREWGILEVKQSKCFLGEGVNNCVND